MPKRRASSRARSTEMPHGSPVVASLPASTGLLKLIAARSLPVGARSTTTAGRGVGVMTRESVFLDRDLAEHGTAAYHPTLRNRVVRRRAMHQAAVVPYDELAGFPAMLVREVRVNCELV